MESGPPKSLVWVGTSKDDLKKFPGEVQHRIGFALFQAQIGIKHRDAKPLSGFGPGLLEVVSRFDKETYRAVYTVIFPEVIYVLHAFQKKSRKGIATPKSELDLVKQRLKVAEQHYQDTYK